MYLINKILMIVLPGATMAAAAGESVNIQMPSTSPSKLASGADSSAEVTSYIKSFLSIIVKNLNVNKLNLFCEL